MKEFRGFRVKNFVAVSFEFLTSEAEVPSSPPRALNPRTRAFYHFSKLLRFSYEITLNEPKSKLKAFLRKLLLHSKGSLAPDKVCVAEREFMVSVEMHKRN